MNFATPAVLLVLVFLPGVLARSAYLRGRWESHPFKTASIVEEVAYGAGLSLLFHYTWMCLCLKLGSSVNLKAFLTLAYGPGTGNDGFEAAKSEVAANWQLALTYFVSLYAAALISGQVAHRVIRWWKLDLKFQPFRFAHDWFYLFSSERLQFKNRIGDRPNVFTLVALLIEQSGSAYIYRGVLDGFFYDEDGQLDRILLQDPYRATLEELEKIELDTAKELKGKDAATIDKMTQEKLSSCFKPIDGTYMVLFASDVRNINIKYLQLSPTPGPGTSSPARARKWTLQWPLQKR